jgi:hypothetical protein
MRTLPFPALVGSVFDVPAALLVPDLIRFTAPLANPHGIDDSYLTACFLQQSAIAVGRPPLGLAPRPRQAAQRLSGSAGKGGEPLPTDDMKKLIRPV